MSQVSKRVGFNYSNYLNTAIKSPYQFLSDIPAPLYEKAKNGDNESFEIILKTAHSFIKSELIRCNHKLKKEQISIESAEQAGVMAVQKWILNYDRIHTSPGAYLKKAIASEIVNHIREESPFMISKGDRAAIQKNRESLELTGELNSHNLNCSRKSSQFIKAASSFEDVLLFSEKIGDLAISNDIYPVEAEDSLTKIMKSAGLSDETIAMIKLKHEASYTSDEIASMFNISPRWVNKKTLEGLKKVRMYLDTHEDIKKDLLHK